VFACSARFVWWRVVLVLGTSMASLLAHYPVIARQNTQQPPAPGVTRAAQSSVLLSPDGTRLLWKVFEDGATSIWESPWRDLESPTLIARVPNTVSQFAYTQQMTHVVFAHANAVTSVDRTTGTSRRLGPPEAQTRLLAVSQRAPGMILLGINSRDTRYFDAFRTDIRTGAMQPVQEQTGVEGSWFLESFAFDNDLHARLLIGTNTAGERVLLHNNLDGGQNVARPIGSTQRGTLRWYAFRDDLPLVYCVESTPAGSALRVVDLTDDSQATIFEVPNAQIDRVLMRPGNAGVQAIRLTQRDGGVVWSVRDSSIEQDLVSLKRSVSAPFDIIGRADDRQTWLVRWQVDGQTQLAIYSLSTRLVQPVKLPTPQAPPTENPTGSDPLDR
jgi:hypothetical protein